MTAHVDTGEPLPRALFDKMTAAKNFQSGLQTLRQIEFSLFDMRLHTEYDAADARPATCMALLDEVRAEVAVMPPPPFSRTPNTFSHIFSGGYAAGYYSYKWAEVLSADAYAAFEEAAGDDGMPERRDRPALPRGDPRGRRQPHGDGVVQGLPRPRAATRRAVAPPGHGRAATGLRYCSTDTSAGLSMTPSQRALATVALIFAAPPLHRRSTPIQPACRMLCARWFSAIR